MKCGAEHGGSDPQDVAAAAHKLQDTLDHSTDAANSNQETSERRARVKDLFYAMDKDGNGKLDVGEFRGQSCHKHFLCHVTTTAASCPIPSCNAKLLYAVDVSVNVFGIWSSCLRSEEAFGQA